MEHISLYRRFRPSTFDKVIGQKHIVRTLTNQIKNNRIGHAYLFTGTRGTGKTSCAKIFARAVNCLNPVNGSPCGECEVCRQLSNPSNIDILEIDAASNNGVDEIRDIKENAQYRPAVGRYKVYIIDEVHMLSTAAFNALLKTLEEPPEHVIFILATTEVNKLPQTILSRCMRFDFRLVGKDELIKLLKDIFDELNVEADMRALGLIAAGGEGCVRDALSLADMCLSYGGDKITYEDALEITCTTSFSALDELATAILDGRCGDALKAADRLLGAGRNTLSKDLSGYFMDMLNLKNVPDVIPDGVTDEEAASIREKIDAYSNYRIARVMDIMSSLENAIRFSSQPKVMVEAAIIRACELITEIDLDGLTNRIKELEKKIADMEVNGVAVKARAEAEEVAEEDEPEPVAEEKKSDLNELLSSVAAAESEIVFEDAQKSSQAESLLAGEIWGKVIIKLQDSNEMMLKMAVNGVEGGYYIDGGRFILETDDNATLQLLNRPEYINLMQTLICDASGKKFVFSCVKRTEDKKINSEDKVTLDKLFNGTVKIRPKK